MKIIQDPELHSISGCEKLSSGGVELTYSEASPIGQWNTYQPNATMSQCANIKGGFYLSGDGCKDAVAPFNLFGGRYGSKYCFEIRLFEDGEPSDKFRQFSSCFEQDPNGLIKAIPMSFFSTLYYLCSELPGYEKALLDHMISLLAEEQPYEEITEDTGEVVDYIYGLHQTAKNVLAKLLLSGEEQAVEITNIYSSYTSDRFLVSNRWVESGMDGTYKQSDDGENLGLLCETGIGSRYGVETYTVYVSQPTGEGANRVVAFTSDNTFPDKLPQACYSAIEYLCSQYPARADLAATLVIGKAGWDLHMVEWASDCLNDAYYVAAELYEKETGKRLKGFPGFYGWCEDE